MRLLAEVIYRGHAAFTLAMLVSPAVLPWQVVANLCAGVAVLNLIGGGRCPLTRWEWRLRRNAAAMGYWPIDTTRFKVGDKLILGTTVMYVTRIAPPDGLMLCPDMPGESVMGRLLRVVGVRLSPAAVNRLMLALFVLLPLLAWAREVSI